MKYETAEERTWVVEQCAPDIKVRTKTYALRIVRLYTSLPKTTEAQVIGKQLLRSGTSVGANYREAYRLGRQLNSSLNAAYHSKN